jgi:putative DNA primase/helicase
MNEAVDRVLRALEAKGCKPRKTSNGWEARCPAHDDRRASFSLSQGEKGALVRCFAGCTHEAIARSLGLEEQDLFDDNNDGRGRVATVKPKPTKADKPKQVFRTMEDALAAYRRTLGNEAAMWPYHSADGEIAGYSVRWTLPDGRKEIRPIARVADGWIRGHMPEPRPLFNLPAVIASDTVVIVEGEKCAEALIGLGIVATTSVQGSNAPPDKTDWSPLAGRRVIVVPDHDAPGEKYAFSSVAPYAHAAGAESVSVVRLADHWPECPAGGDIADWIEARGDAAEPDAIREEIEQIFAKAEPVPMGDDEQSCGPANVHDQSTWSDVGFAKRLIAESNGQILYVADGGPKGHGGWYWFNKGRWEPDASCVGPMRFAKAAGQKLWDEHCALGPDGPKGLYPFVRRCNSEAGFRAAIRIATSDESVEARMADFDRDDYLLNCPNGVLNLETAELGSV